MLFAGVILTLLAVTVVSFLVGAFWLSKYASRLSAAQAALVLLVPPYTFYFAFYKLQVEGKEMPSNVFRALLVVEDYLEGSDFPDRDLPEVPPVR